MKKGIMLFLLFVVMAPSAFAYKSAAATRSFPAYVQDGNQNLC